MQVLVITAFKIRYSTMILCFMKCITGIFESIHFCCYNGRSIEGNEDFINAKKSTYSKIQNKLTKTLANGVFTLNDMDSILFEACQVNNHCVEAGCNLGEFAMKRTIARISVRIECLQNRLNACFSDFCLQKTLFNNDSMLYEVYHGHI